MYLNILEMSSMGESTHKVAEISTIIFTIIFIFSTIIFTIFFENGLDKESIIW